MQRELQVKQMGPKWVYCRLGEVLEIEVEARDLGLVPVLVLCEFRILAVGADAMERYE